MPTAYFPLQETNRSILSASYYKVIKQLLRQTNIPYGTLIAMHKGMEINRTDNETNLSSHTAQNLPSTAARRKVIVDISEEYNEDALGTTAVSYRDNPPIFVDPQIDLSVYPVYVSTDITFKISYTTPSKSEANQLRDDLRVKLSQMRNIAHHEVEYDILVPAGVQDLIADSHVLKSRLHPGELGEYFYTFATRQAYMLTDTANKENAHLAVRERQVRIVGQFEFSPMPEAVEESNDTNTYRLTIPYKFTMQIAKGMCVSYNPIVCNRPMPSKYLQWVVDSKTQGREEYSRNLTYTHSLGALSHFEAHRQLDYRINNKLPLNLPLFDEFPTRQGHPGYVITATFLTSVNEDDRRTLFNLKEIPDFYMDAKFLEFIAAGERVNMVIPYRSLFYFGLYYPDQYFDHDCLEITADLTVRSKVALPLDKPTRVAFSVLADTSFLQKDTQKRWYPAKDMVLLYMREYMSVLQNYGHELGNIKKDHLSFQRLVVVFLQSGINDKDSAFLSEVLKICAIDNLTIESLVNFLTSSYPHIYQQLTRYVDMQSMTFHKTASAEPSDFNTYIQRSIMTTYTEAHLRAT